MWGFARPLPAGRPAVGEAKKATGAAVQGLKSRSSRVGAGTFLGMTAIEFTREELALMHHALAAFLSDFGHKEKDVVHQLQQLMVKIPEPT
jgi:hypothetical protein